MSNPIVHLYKASAGAGKTYTLAKEFIKLLIEDPFSYKRILAVTFTNKATEEMQSRIVNNLFSISKGLKIKKITGMIDDIISEWDTEWNTEEENDASEESLRFRNSWKLISAEKKREKIRENAQLALFLILHDYNHFQISTIDSFFQIILRNLAKELGLGAYLNIVIDETEPLDEAIKLLINDLRSDANLKNWINSYSEEKSDNNKSWKIDQDIAKFGRNIFNDNFKEIQDELSKTLRNQTFLSSYRDELNKKMAIEKEAINKIVERIDKEIADSIYTVDDFSYKTSGAYSYVNNFKKAYAKKSEYSNCIPLAESTRANTCVNQDPDSWASKTNKRHDEIVLFAKSKLNPLFLTLEKQRSISIPHILTCQLILEHIYKIGIIHTLASRVRELNESRNQFLLSDTPTLLNNMISDGDAPFIYEKVGTSLEHIMIDEFQDTSLTQWHNFKPLIKECLAQQKSNLIVGDAKQSIYRFRNGDWRIIEGLKKEKGFPNASVVPTNLVKNWRSEWEVVNFNNSIFSPACDENGNLLNSTDISPILKVLEPEYSSHPLYQGLCSVYQSAFQECVKTNPKEGFVSIEFLDTQKKPQQAKGNETTDEEEEIIDESILEKLLHKIEEIQDKGIAAEDIAILTRKGKEIIAIADYFSHYKKAHPESKYNYTIISNEAFKLESSKALQMIIDAMRVIVNPEDQIAMAQLFVNYQKESLKKKQQKNISETLSLVSLQNDKDYIELKNKLLEASNLPFFELVEKLCVLLNISQIKDQESYLFYFLDSVNDYITRKSPDIARFIDYWERYLKNKSIPFSDNVKGIKIMTIHKSKGLEFKTVIIPFCTWKLYGENSESNAPILWCSTHDTAPYNMLPFVPVKFCKKMKESIFSENYTEERIQLLADAINLLYVAFTRAEENLIIFAEKPQNTEGKGPKETFNTCSDLLYQLFSAKLADKNTFNSGELKKIVKAKTEEEKKEEEKEKKEKQKNPFEPEITSCRITYQSHEQKARFKQSSKASQLMQEICSKEVRQDNARKRGILLHHLFSVIHTEDDIETAVNELISEGIISREEEKEQLIQYAHKKIAKHKEWFRKGLTLFNERKILFTKNGAMECRIPDRVIVEGNTMTVIDFKTGENARAHQKNHQDQINEYVELLQKMYPSLKITSHLWYLDED